MPFACLVVLYRFSTSNHNSIITIKKQKRLYYIVSLHQTTTEVINPSHYTWLYYIVSLHQTTTRLYYHHSKHKLYYIVSLHQTTTKVGFQSAILGCIISFLYIKPQRMTMLRLTHVSCIISFLYIKPQPCCTC